MQTECSRVFQSEAVLDSLTITNREMLLMQSLEIITNSDFVLYERFIEEWMHVLELLFPRLEIHFINLTVIPIMKQLTQYKAD